LIADLIVFVLELLISWRFYLAVLIVVVGATLIFLFLHPLHIAVRIAAAAAYAVPMAVYLQRRWRLITKDFEPYFNPATREAATIVILAGGVKVSCRRRPASRFGFKDEKAWIPACAGMTKWALASARQISSNFKR
jgi:hypothetical protein